MAEGLIGKRDGKYAEFRNAAKAFLNELADGVGRDRVAVPKKLLLRPLSTEHFLSLAGFHSSIEAYRPFDNFMKLFKQRGRVSDDGLSLEPANLQLAAALAYSAEQVLSLVQQSALRGFQIPDAIKAC